MCSATTRRAAGFISACVSLTASLTAAVAAQAASPGGAASASLCADSYLTTLLEPDEILALSWQVDQPVSAAPDWARAKPRAWADAERLLILSPEVTVFGTGEGGRAARLLGQAGLAYAELGWADDFAGVADNLRQLGDVLGAEARAEAAVADMQARLEALADRATRRPAAPRVVYLSSSGGSAGAGTYIDAAITAAGGRNIIAQAGVSGWTRADPEFALTLKADIVLTSFFTDGYAGLLNRGARHAAYRRLLDHAERVDIPAGDWPCAGPRLILAAEAIADALDAWAHDAVEGDS